MLEPGRLQPPRLMPAEFIRNASPEEQLSTTAARDCYASGRTDRVSGRGPYPSPAIASEMPGGRCTCGATQVRLPTGRSESQHGARAPCRFGTTSRASTPLNRNAPPNALTRPMSALRGARLVRRCIRGRTCRTQRRASAEFPRAARLAGWDCVRARAVAPGAARSPKRGHGRSAAWVRFSCEVGRARGDGLVVASRPG
jgi:hypothetical protein